MTVRTRTYKKSGKVYTYTTTAEQKWETKVKKSGIQPEKYMEFYLDPKDTEEYPEPETHHTIKCRYCFKESVESKRYRLSCLECRESQKYRRLAHSSWDTWSNIP